MEKTALLIIDVQVSMFSYEDMYPFNGDLVLQNIRKLLSKAREINMPVVFVQHTDLEEYQKGTDTWQICPEIAPYPNEDIVEKPTWDSFHRTKLHEVLQRLKVENLIIMGMQTEFCVDTTCRRAYSMGYSGVVIKDAHTTFSSKILPAEKIIDHHNNIWGGRFVQLKTTEEVLALMK